MMTSPRITADDIAVPEALYFRYHDHVSTFTSKSGVILCRDRDDRPLSPAMVARALGHLGGTFPDPRRDHPISVVAEGGNRDHPLLFLDAKNIRDQTGEAWPTGRRGEERLSDPHSSMGCYIPPETMLSKFGLQVGACGITGQLLPGRESSKGSWFDECQDSLVRQSVQTGEITLEVLEHIKEIEDMLNNAAALDRPIVAERHASPDGYDTDAPVSDLQKLKGIVAWRRLENPADADQAIMLPIYDTDAVPYDSESVRKAEAAKVPRAGDEGFPENYLDYDGILYPLAVVMVTLRDSPMLWGGAGLGKSAAYRHLAYLMGLPFERISITPSTEVDELAGKMEYHPDEGTVFQYGRLAHAWTKPSVICLDEPNSARPDVWFMLRPLLDSEKQFAIDASKGEILPRHDSSYLGLAANPSWDYRNAGTNPLADADMRRLTHVQVGLPPERIEADIIKSHCQAIGFSVSDRQLKQMRAIATDLRDTAAGGSLMFSWGTASQLKAAKLLPYMTMEQAYQAALGAALEPEQEDLFMSTVRGHV